MHRTLSRRWVLQAGALVPLLVGPRSADAGRQLEEPLADSVRTALGNAVAGSGEPPQPVFTSPAQQQDYPLAHSDNVEASGFVQHLKLPHYVTFESELQMLRAIRADLDQQPQEAQE